MRPRDKAYQTICNALEELGGRAQALVFHIAELELVKEELEAGHIPQPASRQKAKRKRVKSGAPRRASTVEDRGRQVKKGAVRKPSPAKAKQKRAKSGSPRRSAPMEMATPAAVVTRHTAPPPAKPRASVKNPEPEVQAQPTAPAEVGGAALAPSQGVAPATKKPQQRKPWSAEARSRVSARQKAQRAEKRRELDEAQEVVAGQSFQPKAIVRKKQNNEPANIVDPAAVLKQELTEFMSKKKGRASQGLAIDGGVVVDRPAMGPVAMAAAGFRDLFAWKRAVSKPPSENITQASDEPAEQTTGS